MKSDFVSVRSGFASIASGELILPRISSLPLYLMPVATFAVGAAGATNAALFAASILAPRYPAIAEALQCQRQAQTAAVLAHPDPRVAG